jgi:hypothetical protein
VVGILIALAIDNYNDNRIIRNKEQTYLHGLKNEFETSKWKLEELIQVNKQKYENARLIVELIDHPDSPPAEQQFSELLFNTFAFDIHFNPNNSLLNEMINSGSLKDISNPELRKQLTTWIATIEDITQQEDDQQGQQEKVLNMFRTDDNSIRTVIDLTGVGQNEIGLSPKNSQISNLSLLKSITFENNILIFILSSQATEKAHYQPLMEDLITILELIKLEIKE